MGRVTLDTRAINASVARFTLAFMRGLGPAARDDTKARTPVRTGYAQRSVFYLIMDEQGNIVGGDSTDENGEPCAVNGPVAGYAGLDQPSAEESRGAWHLYIGANADYYIWIEIGARGREGRFVMARTADFLRERLGTWAGQKVRL